MSYQQGTLRRVGPDVLKEQSSVLDWLKSSSIQVEDITVRKKTLEDVFINLTGRGLRE